MMMVRDQDAVLDVGTVAAAARIALRGGRWGARGGRGAGAVVAFVAILFIATPSLISGSDRIDTRLAPLVPMLFFAVQDWSAVGRRRRRAVMCCGFALLGARLAITTASFVGYDRRYRLELSALDHVPQGARILALTRVDCVETAWRSERLEHLPALATLSRGAWVNAHWSIGGLQLLQVRFRPSPAYYRDPSQLIWPAACVDPRRRFDERDRHTLAETLPRLPLARVDYLWLLGARIPSRERNPRLTRVWSDDISELYLTRSAAARIAAVRSSAARR